MGVVRLKKATGSCVPVGKCGVVRELFRVCLTCMETTLDPSILPSPTEQVLVERVEEPATNASVLHLLNTHNAIFSTLLHHPTLTSEESAAIRGVPLATGAKAMLLKAGKLLPHGTPYLLAVLSASRKANLKVLRNLLGMKSISLASLDDVWRLSHCLPGAVPPFGSLFQGGVATYVDESIVHLEVINFNAGLRSFSILNLSVKDYLAIEKPIILSFSEPLTSLSSSSSSSLTVEPVVVQKSSDE